jgi:hypothetical protein
MPHLFNAFLVDMTSSFRRIAYATKLEATVSDLQSEAWIVASEISAKRGVEIDFSDPVDRDLIMGHLHTRNVSRKDWRLHSAVRIDEEQEGDVKWVEKLPARPGADPLVQLLMREQYLEDERKLMRSFSQATAYVRAFAFFKQCRKSLCAHLAISDNLLASRISHAARVFEIQDSLFDGKAKIPNRFNPAPGMLYAPPSATPLTNHAQLSWDFF